MVCPIAAPLAFEKYRVIVSGPKGYMVCPIAAPLALEKFSVIVSREVQKLTCFKYFTKF